MFERDRPNDPRFPGAPAGSYVCEEGWLCYADEAWTAEDWARRWTQTPIARRHRYPETHIRQHRTDEERIAARRESKRRYQQRKYAERRQTA